MSWYRFAALFINQQSIANAKGSLEEERSRWPAMAGTVVAPVKTKVPIVSCMGCNFVFFPWPDDIHNQSLCSLSGVVD
jgi:hypothetical protein